MSRMRVMKGAAVAGALCLVVAACDSKDVNQCICTENQSPFNTQEVPTTASCSEFAETHASEFSSCIESSESIIGPSRPLAKFISPRPGGLTEWLRPRLSGNESALLIAQLEEIGGSRYFW